MEYTQLTTQHIDVEENAPNASKLLNSLRHLDYSNTSAICDILDNSIDAGANHISVSFDSDSPKNLNKIFIWDDGAGMDEQIISQALRLGSDTEKNHNYDLGRYGMGLVTASLSIGRNLSVATLGDDGGYIAVQDLDEIAETNKFTIRRRKMTPEEEGFFLSELKKNTSDDTKTGTLISIAKIDKWDWKLLSAWTNALDKSLGQVFRKFIEDSDKQIFVHGKIVEAIDPIKDMNSKLLAEKDFDVEGEAVSVRLFEAEDFGMSLNKEKGINIPNQGFYVLRNNREIAVGQDFGLWTKHNQYNLFRAEFIYPGSLDHVFNAGFTKQKIAIEGNQSFRDKLNQFLSPHLKQIREHTKQRQADNRKEKEDFTEVEKFITRKIPLLRTPPVKKESRQTNKDPKKKPASKPTGEGSPRLDIKKEKRIRDLASLKVKFETKSMDKTGPLYRPEMIGDVTHIFWNVEHPFYQGFIIPNENDKSVMFPICYLVYSLASAELRSAIDSHTEEIIEHIRADFSLNLKVLMK